MFPNKSTKVFSPKNYLHLNKIYANYRVELVNTILLAPVIMTSLIIVNFDGFSLSSKKYLGLIQNLYKYG